MRAFPSFRRRLSFPNPAALRVDLLNLFNDPLFIGPVSTFGSGTFGQVNTLGGFARSLQFHVRLGW